MQKAIRDGISAVSHGSFEIKGLQPSSFEKKVMGMQGVSTSYTIDSKSPYNQIMLGYCPNEYVCTEASYIWDVHVHDTFTISNMTPGTINLGGTGINPGTLSSAVSMTRDVDVSATRLSVSGRYPFTTWMSGFVRLGVVGYQAQLTTTIPLYQDVMLAQTETQSGEVLMASVGMRFRLMEHVDTGVEYLNTQRISMTSVDLRIKFP